MNIKKISNIKEHRISANFLAILVFILVIGSIISTAFLFRQTNKSTESMERERDYRIYATELINASDYLTNKVYYYVVTGKEQYRTEYYTELNEVKRREDAVDNLYDLGVTKDEQDLISATLDLSNDLAEIEIQSFYLVEAGKKEEAQILIFSKEYEDYKNKIHINYAILKDGIENRIAIENRNIENATQITFFVSSIVAIGTTISIVLLLFTLFRIKKESNIDQLTGLQNRNKYKEHINELIIQEPDKFGALLYCDIDNLKFVNDCYGHNCGDRYIQATANVLKEFGEYPSVLARPSGDEFIVYIHGFNTREEINTVISENLSKAKNAYFTTSLHIQEKVRFSTGIAVYPTDTSKIDELIKFADYAMYKMKKHSKGEIAFYDSSTLDKTLFLARNNGYLDDFLDNALLDFALQPIVYADTFEILGYEALMRPKSDIINTPYLLLELAKAESKLDKIERLVMKKAFEKIKENKDQLKNYKVFVNSIADQILTEKEFEIYKDKYPDILSSLVIEVTEQEYADQDLVQIKSEMFKSVGALMAIDDFGSGYSNENALLGNDYDIIKLDMNLIRNIDSDNRRKQMVKSIINFLISQDLQVLAEGVETENEVRTLRELGVHYMQGYYFGKPDLEIKGVSDQALKFLEEEMKKL